MEPKYRKIIKELYHNNTATVNLPVSKSATVNLLSLPDPLSPDLFNFVLETVFQQIKWKEWKGVGIKVNGKLLTNLRIEDDVAVFTAEELQQQLQRSWPNR